MDGKVVLVRNERNEWELPGGRLEIGETPEQALAREFRPFDQNLERKCQAVSAWLR